jgi:predicted DNA-binding WGR domain protein
MITLLSHRPKTSSFYRVDVCYNLFGEYTVSKEWGRPGKNGHHRIFWFSNLRDAIAAADHWHCQAHAKGYNLTEVNFA